MEWIGDLERWVANTVYPWRIPLALVLVAAAGVLGVVLARRGILGRVLARGRARPVLSGVLLVLVIATAGPATYYLTAPLWTRSALQESNLVTVPTAEGGAMASGVGAGPSAEGARLIGQGDIAGADAFHFGRGRAELIALDGAHILQVREFSVRNGPDLFVYLSSSATRPDAGAVQLGRLKATDGEFRYDLPPGATLPANPHFLVWCEQFAVLFASASLAPGS